MKNILKGLASLVLTLVLIAFVLLHAAEVSVSAYHALALSASSVVPALFPLCVLAMFLQESNAAQRWKFLQPVTRLFRIDSSCISACILGCLCGYPVGAAVISSLYKEQRISADSAERALAFCNNASPAFLVAVAGSTLFGSVQVGLLLLIVHLISACLTGVILGWGKSGKLQESKTKKNAPLPAAFTKAVQRASLTMVQITGFIVLFSVILCLLEPLLRLLPGNGVLRAIAGGFLELTNGLHTVSSLDLPLNLRFILASAMLGWSGLCVHMQVLSFVLPLGLSPAVYLKGKVLQCALSSLLAAPMSLFLPKAIPAALYMAKTDGRNLLLLWSLGFTALFFYLLFYNQHSIINEK